MQVRATKEGFDGLSRRKPGQVFELRDPKLFAESWMVKIKETEDAVAEPEKPAEPAPKPTKAKEKSKEKVKKGDDKTEAPSKSVI